MFGKILPQNISPLFNDTSLDRSTENEFESNPNYIFYDKNKEFKQQIEVLVKHEEQTYFIVTDIQCQMEEFITQTERVLLTKPKYFKLKNLQITKLSRQISTKTFEEIPIKDKVQDHLKTGDVIVCELSTEEFWSKVEYELKSKVMKRKFNIEFKLNKKVPVYKWKLLLLKYGIDLFITESLTDKSTNNYHFTYYIEEVMYTINSLQQKLSDNLFDCDYISKHVSFNTNVNVSLYIGIFEEFIYNEIKLLTFPETAVNIRKFNEMKDTSFYGFIEDDNFEAECVYINNIIKDIYYDDKYHNKEKDILFYSYKHKDKEKLIHDEHNSSMESDLCLKERYDDIMNENVICNSSINDLDGNLKMIIVLPDLTQKRNNTTKGLNTVRQRKKIFTMKNNDIKIYKSFANSKIDNDYYDYNESIHKSGYSEELCIDIDNKRKKLKRKTKGVDSKKHTFIDSVRNSSKFVNLVEDFKAKFSLDVIYKHLKEKRKFNIKEETFLNLKLPISRELTKLSLEDEMNEFEKHLQLEGENISISNHKILIFVFIVLLYFSFILVVINLDLYIYSI